MQVTDLPAQIALDRLAAGPHRWQGSISGEKMTRLAGAVSDIEAVSATIHIDVEARRKTVSGQLQAILRTTCERCLGPMSLTVETDFSLFAVDRPQSAETSGADEAIVETPRGQLDVRAMLEDEIILALPVVARHDDPHCDGAPRHFGPDEQGELPERENPFKVLEALKREPRQTD